MFGSATDVNRLRGARWLRPYSSAHTLTETLPPAVEDERPVIRLPAQFEPFADDIEDRRRTRRIPHGEPDGLARRKSRLFAL